MSWASRLAVRASITTAARNVCANLWDRQEVLMELVGEEKRIQALFSEARLADEQTTPSFVRVGNRAQAKPIRAQRAFNLSCVAATALLVCALVSLAWWSMHWQRSPEVIASAPPAPVTVPATVAGEQTNSVPPVDLGQPVKRRLASRSKSNTI